MNYLDTYLSTDPLPSENNYLHTYLPFKAKQENGYHKSIQLYSVIEEPSLSYPSYCVINVLLKAHPIFHLVRV